MNGQFRNHTVAALILCAAATAPCAAGDTEPPALVVFTTAGAARNAPPLTGDGEATLNSLREDPNVSMLRIGQSAPKAVLQATAFSLVLSPAPRHAVHFRDVERTDHADGMVSLYARDGGAGSDGDLHRHRRTRRIGAGARRTGKHLRLTPLGGGLTAVYRYDTSNFRMHPPGWDPGGVPSMDTVPREARDC